MKNMLQLNDLQNIFEFQVLVWQILIFKNMETARHFSKMFFDLLEI